MSRGSSQGYRLADLENVLSERRWSQADLARRTGLSATTVRRAAVGSGEVSAWSAKKIARALGVRIGTLCRDRGQSRDWGSTSMTHGASRELDFDPRRMSEAMAERGMNPTEIAARTELSVATVSSALRGLREPREDTIQRLAEVVGKAPAELCSGAERCHTSPHAPSLRGQSAEPTTGELRLVAGQSRTTLYPAEADESNGASEPPQKTVGGAEIRAGIEEERTTTESLEGLLWSLGQARQMVGSVMEYIGNLEEQVSWAISYEGEPARTVNNGSGGR
jgi:transcriptional regulator with XRE-family HTH domain